MNDQEKDKLFGEIGVDLGFITTQDVSQALEQQKVDEAIGARKPIGGYLHENGKLNKEQISKIVTMQEKILTRGSNQSLDTATANSRTGFQSQSYSPNTQQKEKKSLAIVIVLNIVWAGSGYFYIGKNEKGTMWSIINLLLIWTGIVPLIICIMASVDANNIMQQENL